MALLYSSPLMLRKSFTPPLLSPSSSSNNTKRRAGASRTSVGVRAFFNPFEDQPILKDALKEPVAFMGGVFAGLLRLDLNEDPLREWITQTVEASGMSPDELADARGESGKEGEEDAPQQIEIE